MINKPKSVNKRRLILLTVLLILCGWVYYLTTDTHVGRLAERELALIMGGQVHINQAHWHIGESIRITGMKVVLPDPADNAAPAVFHARELVIDMPGLPLFGNLSPAQITVAGGKLNIWYDSQKGLTNLQQLNPCRRESLKPCPELAIEDFSVSFGEIAAGKFIPILNQSFQGMIGQNFPSRKIAFELKECHTADDMSFISGSYDPGPKTYSFKGQSYLDFLPETLEGKSRSLLQKQIRALNPSGLIMWDGEFDSEGHFTASVRLENGMIDIPLSQKNASLPLTNVNGNIAIDKHGIHLQGIEGGFRDHFTLNLTGDIQGFNQSADYALKLRMTGLDVPPRQWTDAPAVEETPANSRELSVLLNALYQEVTPETREFIDRYRPTGRVDFALNLTGKGTDMSQLAWDARCEFKDTDILYQEFPYRFRGFKGLIAFDPTRTVVHNLHAVDEGRMVNVEGAWYKRGHSGEMDFTITLNDIPLDQRLYQAVEPWQKHLWNQFDPEGIVDAVYKFTKQPGETKKGTLDVTLREVDAGFVGLGIRFTGLHGRASYRNRDITFDLVQDMATGVLGLKGRYANLNQPDEHLRCDLILDGVMLNEEFIGELPPGIQEKLTVLDVNGKIDGKVNLAFKPESTPSPETAEKKSPDTSSPESFDYSVHFTLSEGTLRYNRFPWPLGEVRAECEITEEALKIVSLQGRHNKSRIQLKGTLRRQDDYVVEIEGNPVVIDGKLHQALNELGLDLKSSFDPCGPANVYMWLHQEPEKPLGYMAVLEPSGCRLRWSKFPYPMQNVTGRVEIEPGRIRLDKFRSTDGPQRIEITGEINRDPNDLDSHLNVQAAPLVLDDTLRGALPDKAAALFELVKPDGRVGLDLNLKTSENEEGETGWQVTGTVHPEQLSVDYPCQIDGMSGVAALESRFKREGDMQAISLQFDDVDMDMYHRRLTGVTGGLTYDREKQEFLIRDISGEIFNGRMAGEAVIRMNENRKGYEMDMKFLEGQLAELFPHLKDTKSEFADLKGRFNGRLHIQKNSADEPRRGSYNFVIKDAVLGRLPVIARLLHFINLTVPKAGAFNEAELSGDIVNGMAKLTRIKLDGSALNLTGAGVIQKPFLNGLHLAEAEGVPNPPDRQGGMLELYFLIEPPEFLPRLPVLTSFFEAIRPELMKLRVTGHFYEPKVESVAFPTLEEAVKRLEMR